MEAKKQDKTLETFMFISQMLMTTMQKALSFTLTLPLPANPPQGPASKVPHHQFTTETQRKQVFFLLSVCVTYICVCMCVYICIYV